MDSVEAQALAYALEVGAARIEDVRSWADSEILVTSTPREELLTLATEPSVPGAISLLHTLGDGAEKPSVGRRVYHYVLRAMVGGGLSPVAAAEAVVRLAREQTAPSRDAENASWHFDDAFYLADKGIYGNRDVVATELEDHLRRYAA